MSNKPKLSYIITSDSAIQDLNTKKWTMIGIFQEIIIPKNMETVAINFFTMIRITELKLEKLHLTVKIIDPKEKEFARVELENKNFDKSAIDVAVNLNGLIFNSSNPGKYKFQITINDELLERSDEYGIKLRHLDD